MGLPSWLSGTIDLLGVTYPLYRFLIIVAGLAVAAGCYALIHRTRLGMLIRAGSTDRMMVGALGVNIARLNTLLFVLGAVLAGVAGLMAGPILSAQTGMGEPILILTLVVIVIGGIGSVRGAFLAALMVEPGRHAGPRAAAGPAARGAAAGGGQRGRPGDRLDADLCRHGAGAGAAAAGPVPRAARIGRPRHASILSPRAGCRFAAAGAGAGAAVCAVAGRTLPAGAVRPGAGVRHRRAGPEPAARLRRHGQLRPCAVPGPGRLRRGRAEPPRHRERLAAPGGALAPAPWSAWSAATWRCAPPASPSS